MYNLYMPILFKARHVVYGLIIATSLPLFAVFCRGYVPSRFQSVNVPVWEQTPPHCIPNKAREVWIPLRYAANYGRTSLLFARAIAEEPIIESALQSRESTSQSAVHVAAAARCLTTLDSLVGESGPTKIVRDRLAFRLMGQQDADGWFVALGKNPVINASVLKSQSEVTTSLVEYYRVAQNDSVIYSCLRAANALCLIAQQASSPCHNLDLGCSVFPLALVYESSGDRTYLRQALLASTASDATCCGILELYAITGNTEFVKRAWTQWEKSAPPSLPGAERLLELSGDGSLLGSVAWIGRHYEELPIPAYATHDGCVIIATDPGNFASHDLVVKQRVPSQFSRVLLIAKSTGPLTNLRLHLDPAWTNSASVIKTLVNGKPFSKNVASKADINIHAKLKTGDVVTVTCTRLRDRFHASS